MVECLVGCEVKEEGSTGSQAPTPLIMGILDQFVIDPSMMHEKLYAIIRIDRFQGDSSIERQIFFSRFFRSTTLLVIFNIYPYFCLSAISVCVSILSSILSLPLSLFLSLCFSLSVSLFLMIIRQIDWRSISLWRNCAGMQKGEFLPKFSKSIFISSSPLTAGHRWIQWGQWRR